jgi:hypothetical protein
VSFDGAEAPATGEALPAAGELPAAEPLSPPAAAAPRPPVVVAVPGVRESVAGALDLAVASSRQVRTLSVFCGLLVLALLGPAIVLFLAIVRDVGDLGQALNLAIGPRVPFSPPEPGSITLLRLAIFGAFVGGFAVLIEGQILVTAALGAAMSSRRLGLRDLLQLSRRVFWPVLGAAILVGIVGRASEIAVEVILRPETVSAYQSVYVVQLVTAALATAPFAFWMAGIVIGGVGPIESLKRSARIAARRWRLAILVASAGTALGLIELFAFGAGLDLVSRVATALGLDIEGSASNAIAVALVTLAGVVAASSLLVTIAALVAAPQVYIFIRMTGYTGGLDRAVAVAAPGALRTRLVTLPMIALIGLAALAAVAGLAGLDGLGRS